ncbi:hypothetical protein [Halomarina oriensis]|uniref:Uncharacterized protein n=1 Tax=Halomarina oriensis TaxID=671145 RepID=A0A6B0GQZ2_9EURY|nr:hypothetical protein [Halomarina oriensis]MWG36501.1 hypothetical protein [Halomarina oriensis]
MTTDLLRQLVFGGGIVLVAVVGYALVYGLLLAITILVVWLVLSMAGVVPFPVVL